MTEITDKDRRAARVWAKNWQGDQDDDTSAAARVILATVDAPPRTLAEGLEYRADLLDNGDPDGDTANVLRTLATDAIQMEHDLTEARAEVERLTAVAEDYARRATAALTERDEARAEVERLDAVNENLRRTDNYRQFREQFLAVQKGAESNAETPDPADVPSEEMWLIRTKKDQLMAGVRNPNGDWSVLAHNGFARECELDDEAVTLVARLVRRLVGPVEVVEE